jgi:flagellar biosynthesis protein FliP
MTTIDSFFRPSHRPWRIRRQPQPQPAAARQRPARIGWLAATFCFILALLTVLSIAPVLLLTMACEFSPECLVRGFGRFLVGPEGVRKPAVVVLLGPILVLLAYVVVFVRCHRRRDVIDRTGRALA